MNKKRLAMLLAMVGTTVLSFLATTTSASACYWGFYQPKEPKLLRK